MEYGIDDSRITSDERLQIALADVENLKDSLEKMRRERDLLKKNLDEMFRSDKLGRMNIEILRNKNERLLDEVLWLSRRVAYLELQQYRDDEWDDDEDYV